MTARQSVLLVGGTGRTGRKVLEQLLERGVTVRAIVRSTGRVPAAVAGHPGLKVVEADLLSLNDTELIRHVSGCSAVVSCLGHTAGWRGVFGPPRDLVTGAVIRLCRAIEGSRPAGPVKFILMSSVSVHHPEGLDTRRGVLEKVFVLLLRVLVPPVRDNQQATSFLYDGIGAGNACVEWVAVRPDTLLEGGVSEYEVHENLVASLFKPDSTNMANVAHFVCELATNGEKWKRWKGRLPVIVNTSSADAGR